MKSLAATGVLTVLGAASAASAIVLPPGSNFSAYSQHFNVHPLPRSDDGGDDMQSRGIKIPMYHHSKRDWNNPADTLKFAENQVKYVTAKWGKTDDAESLRKRQTIGLSDVGQDSFYFGQVSVGTPNQNFNLILDTGSADLWVVDTSCTSSQCTGIALFDPAASSTYKASSTPFEIQYGTGAVRGTLAADTVSLAGYIVNAQTFAIAEQLASNTLNAPTSGIMGMGFEALAQSGATPFWQVVVEQSNIADKLFTFQIGRNVETATSATQVNPGGVFTLGLLDSDQYTGDINYINLSGNEGYWTIPLSGISVGGQTGQVSSNDNVAAIDTGTTLIIAPPSVARQIYAQIPNSQAISSSGSGVGSSGAYAIPCDANVDVALEFGGQTYSINSADMKAGAVDNNGNCLGGILGASLGSGAPSFIVGDVFLKNVFSVYNYDKRAVGFASLKGSAAQTVQTTTGAVQITSNPSATSSGSGGSGGNTPPIISSVASSGSDSTGIDAGSGLPLPSIVSSSIPSSSVSLVAASGDASSDGSGSNVSSASIISAPRLATASVAIAFALGMAFVL